MRKFINMLQRKAGILFPKTAMRIAYWRKMGKMPSLKDPKTINEKIQWQKFNTGLSEIARLSDKFAVREFVSSRGLGDILVPLLGKYDSPRELAASWNSLEAPFVIKANNSCQTVIIVRDKTSADVGSILSETGKWLRNKDFWGFYVEPHYKLIPPCIIVERMLEEKGWARERSSSMIDYKIWCFDGEPACVFICYDRKEGSVCLDCYDLQWNRHSEWLVYSSHYREGESPLPRPEGLERMLECAAILSKGFPQVRVDLYNIEGRIYFGELTFTSNGGYMNYFSEDYLLEMGRRCRL